MQSPCTAAQPLRPHVAAERRVVRKSRDRVGRWADALAWVFPDQHPDCARGWPRRTWSRTEYANNVGETAPEPIRERQRAEVRDLIAQLVPSTEASTGATDAEAGAGASASSSTSASASAANGDGEGTDV